MGKNIIIDCKYGVSKINRYLYGKKLLNRAEEFTEKIYIDETEIEVRKIPLSAKNNIKIVKKFVENLKKEDISSVILSENVKKNEEIRDYLYENFNFFNGNIIKEEFFEKIYYKYLAINNKKDYEAEIVVFSDNPDETYSLLNKICRKLKNVYIVSDNYDGFDDLIKKVYEEYGFYIYFTQKTGNVFLNDRIYINLSEKTDFFLEEAEKNNVIILNLSGKSILSDNVLNTFVFRISPKFKEVMKYFKYCDQECAEFLTSCFKKGTDKAKVKEFIYEQNVNLKKISLKNY